VRRALLATAAAVPLLAAGAGAAAAQSQPYRLRGDALASVQSPTGLLALQGDGAPHPWLHAEALVWVGAGDDDELDALVIAVRAKDPQGRADGRLGRFVLSAGALRPVHVDGAQARLRLPHRFAVEAFGGAPVVPGFGPRAYDWLAGGRVSRALGDWGGAGVAYLHRRDAGILSDEELAFDAGGAAARWLDLGARASLDLIRGGLSEGSATASARRGAWVVELDASHRSPSRLLPATSLFSVLGDQPSQRLGAALRWRAAPRLSLGAEAAAVSAADEIGASGRLRAELRLDDRGDGAVRAELRREAAPGGGWSGASAALRLRLPRSLTASAELELAVPDEPDGRGSVWPWGVAALGWQRGPWDAALAVEAMASPEQRYRIDALARLGRRWESP
jgi:hypothetical protein